MPLDINEWQEAYVALDNSEERFRKRHEHFQELKKAVEELGPRLLRQCESLADKCGKIMNDDQYETTEKSQAASDLRSGFTEALKLMDPPPVDLVMHVCAIVRDLAKHIHTVLLAEVKVIAPVLHGFTELCFCVSHVTGWRVFTSESLKEVIAAIKRLKSEYSAGDNAKQSKIGFHLECSIAALKLIKGYKPRRHFATLRRVLEGKPARAAGTGASIAMRAGPMVAPVVAPAIPFMLPGLAVGVGYLVYKLADKLRGDAFQKAGCPWYADVLVLRSYEVEIISTTDVDEKKQWLRDAQNHIKERCRGGVWYSVMAAELFLAHIIRTHDNCPSIQRIALYGIDPEEGDNSRLYEHNREMWLKNTKIYTGLAYYTGYLRPPTSSVFSRLWTWRGTGRAIAELLIAKHRCTDGGEHAVLETSIDTVLGATLTVFDSEAMKNAYGSNICGTVGKSVGALLAKLKVGSKHDNKKRGEVIGKQVAKYVPRTLDLDDLRSQTQLFHSHGKDEVVFTSDSVHDMIQLIKNPGAIQPVSLRDRLKSLEDELRVQYMRRSGIARMFLDDEDDDDIHDVIVPYDDLYVPLALISTSANRGQMSSDASIDRIQGTRTRVESMEDLLEAPSSTTAVGDSGNDDATSDVSKRGPCFLLGGPGAGKSTWSGYCGHLWAKGELWDFSRHLLILPLRQVAALLKAGAKTLLDILWFTGDGRGDHTKGHSGVYYDTLQNELRWSPTQIEEVCSNLENGIVNGSVIVILDGLDEIDINDFTDTIMLQVILAPLTIVTSRPYGVNAIQTITTGSRSDSVAPRLYEIQGFSPDEITDYCAKYFASYYKDTGASVEASERFVSSLRPQAMEMARVPLLLEIMCYLDVSQNGEDSDSAAHEIDSNASTAAHTLATTYTRLIDVLTRRYRSRLSRHSEADSDEDGDPKGDSPDSTYAMEPRALCTDLISILEWLSSAMIMQDVSSMQLASSTLVRDVIREFYQQRRQSGKDQPVDEARVDFMLDHLARIGFLDCSQSESLSTGGSGDVPWQFLHFSLQEHFAARHVMREWREAANASTDSDWADTLRAIFTRLLGDIDLSKLTSRKKVGETLFEDDTRIRGVLRHMSQLCRGDEEITAFMITFVTRIVVTQDLWHGIEIGNSLSHLVQLRTYEQALELVGSLFLDALAAGWSTHGLSRYLRVVQQRMETCDASQLILLGSCMVPDAHAQYLRRFLDLDENCSLNINIKAAFTGKTPLIFASQYGNAALCEMLLAREGVDLDHQDFAERTALHHAGAMGHARIVTLLLKKGAKIDLRDTWGRTALMVAAERGHAEVVTLLLDARADINSQDKRGHSLLYYAASGGNEDVVNLLLERKAEAGTHALHAAVWRENVTMVKQFITAWPDMVNSVDEDHKTPLHIAARLGNADIMATLLANGADIEARDYDQRTPLHICARKGNLAATTKLIDKGADINSQDKHGHSVLYYAASGGNEDVVNLLLERKPEVVTHVLHAAAWGRNVAIVKQFIAAWPDMVNSVDEDQDTPLHIAARLGNADIVATLLAKGADIEARDDDQCTPLHECAQSGHLAVTTLLIDKGADINSQDKWGHSVLSYAATGGNEDVVNLLLGRKAEAGTHVLHAAVWGRNVTVVKQFITAWPDMVNSVDEDQNTPLHIAARLENVDIVATLLANGADIEARDDDQGTPLHICARRGYFEPAILLLDAGADIYAQDKERMTPVGMAQISIRGGLTRPLDTELVRRAEEGPPPPDA